MDPAVSEIDKKSHVARAGPHHGQRSAAVAEPDGGDRRLGGDTSPQSFRRHPPTCGARPEGRAGGEPDRTVRQHSGAIEHEAISRISGLLDPSIADRRARAADSTARSRDRPNSPSSAATFQGTRNGARRSGCVAGVDGQHAAGDVAAAVAEQIFHHAGDVVDLGQPPQRARLAMRSRPSPPRS